jgi:lysophospholipase L1-like esterase
MAANKHIAMWTCARSRSTLVMRAFQQLDGSMIFDEPFYPPYLLTQGFEHPHRLEIVERYETNYEKVIQKITGDLPQEIYFSFQKHTANNLPKNLDWYWLRLLRNFFLIRHPSEIISSRQKIYNYPKNFTLHEIGMEDLYNLFIFIQKLTEEIPVVIDSTDLVKNPHKVLPALCNKLGVNYSNKMLTWQPGMRVTDPVWAKTWYTTLLNSSGFIPVTKPENALPDHLKLVFEECLPFYEQLYQYRLIV